MGRWITMCALVLAAMFTISASPAWAEPECHGRYCLEQRTPKQVYTDRARVPSNDLYKWLQKPPPPRDVCRGKRSCA